MATSPKNILVFGATGTIGQYLVEALISSKESFGRLGVFTSPTTLQNKSDYINFLKSHNVSIIAGDINSDSDVLAAYKDYDTVVSAVGRNVIAHQIDLIRLAEQTPNIKRFFPSEYGTDIEYDASSASEKPHQLKLKVRHYFKEHVKRLEHTYLVTGPYADGYIGKGWADKRGGSFDVKEKKAVLVGTGEEKVALTTMTDVGKLLVAALQHPEVSKNRALIVNSFTTIEKEILAEYEKQTESKWDVSYTSFEELKKLEEEAWEKGQPQATGFTLRRIWISGRTLYPSRDNEAIGFTQPETLADAVARAIKVQKSG